MSADKAPRTPRRIIFAGANIAFGISFIGLELLGLINGVSPADPDLQANMSLLIVGINLLGGYAGGYLVAKNAPGDALQQGTLTGVLAYIIQQIVHATLYGWGAIGNAFTTLALIGGAVAGAVLLDSQMKRHAKIKAASQDQREEAHDDSDPEVRSEEVGAEEPNKSSEAPPES